MIIHNCEQYSDAWWNLRRGVPTASRANEIVTPKKGDLSTQSRGLINSMIAEALEVQSDPMEATEWMLRGTELEPEARSMFEADKDVDVTEVGFVTRHTESGVIGCSPDGLVHPFTNRGGQKTAQAGFEVKCPKPETHIGYLISGVLPEYYKPQVHMSMAVTGIDKWWFMSYHPELEPLIVPVTWDEYTDRVKDALDAFTLRLATARDRFNLPATPEAHQDMELPF